MGEKPGLKDLDKNGTSADIQILSDFNAANASSFEFGNVDYFERVAVVKSIEREAAKDEWDETFATTALNTLRLISRDNSQLDTIYNSEVLRNYVLGCAGLPSVKPISMSVQVEALKSLVNSLFKCMAMRDGFDETRHSALCDQLLELVGKEPSELGKNSSLIECRHYLCLRILFVITALQGGMRHVWSKGKYVDLLLRELESFANDIDKKIARHPMDYFARGNDILKTIFNIYCKDRIPSDEDTDRMVSTICKIIRSEDARKEHDCMTNCINVISSLPLRIDIFCPPLEGNQQVQASFEGRDMTTVKIILKETEKQLDESEVEDEKAILSMYLTALFRYCHSSHEVRRYVRLIVLPPLTGKDVERRPDEGTTLRNKLIRVMSASVGDSTTIASQLMYVLCKKSVPRLIKYTGFGHSAGLLANAGLLGHINDPKSDENSEDSETEEYAQVENRVNPVTGCIREENLSSPFDGMSEEQKEYEAMKLVDAMQKMMDSGVIQPGTVGDDGKVRAVKHVLELTKDVTLPPEDSDSD